jgi:hypothetical protein
MAGTKTTPTDQRRTYGRVISVLLTNAQHRALQRHVRHTGQSMSTYLRALAIADLAENGVYQADDDPDLRIGEVESQAIAEIEQAALYGAYDESERDTGEDSVSDTSEAADGDTGEDGPSDES